MGVILKKKLVFLNTYLRFSDPIRKVSEVYEQSEIYQSLGDWTSETVPLKE